MSMISLDDKDTFRDVQWEGFMKAVGRLTSLLGSFRGTGNASWVGVPEKMPDEALLGFSLHAERDAAYVDALRRKRAFDDDQRSFYPLCGQCSTQSRA